mmetsp:Transcript_42714/g.117921  ORF Transcript_42714/g.117921 Transcript_42714/m.117921 type:complete len:202 (+) Transcript_42714:682-1287(+)
MVCTLKRLRASPSMARATRSFTSTVSPRGFPTRKAQTARLVRSGFACRDCDRADGPWMPNVASLRLKVRRLLLRMAARHTEGYRCRVQMPSLKPQRRGALWSLESHSIDSERCPQGAQQAPTASPAAEAWQQQRALREMAWRCRKSLWMKLLRSRGCGAADNRRARVSPFRVHESGRCRTVLWAGRQTMWRQNLGVRGDRC